MTSAMRADTAPRTHTFIGLRPVRPPAEIDRPALHQLATRLLARLHGNADPAHRVLSMLASGLIAVLAKLATAEREARFQAGRVEFTQTAMQRTIDDLQAALDEARASIRMLSVEAFREGEPTRTEEDFETSATAVRAAVAP